jgi:glutamate dehydrogenase
VRIDANELSCRIFAEGANLSITDKGRVQFAKRGGGGYTAFLDNSGGVDTSDHEVNTKILYAPLLQSQEVTREHRNEMLRSVEEEMCERVLENNRSQSRMVSYDVRRSRIDPWRFVRALDRLSRAVPFDPSMFAMPDEEELMARYRKGGGVFKCEAAVLCSHAKMLSYRMLLESEPLPSEVETRLVRAYFPPSVVADVGDAAISNHLLGREIATTMLVNRVVDSCGATFLGEVSATTGAGEREVAVAYYHAATLGDVFALQSELYGLESKYNQEAVYAAMESIASAMERAVHQLLDAPHGSSFDTLVAKTTELLDLAPSVLSTKQQENRTERIKEFVLAGLPESVAEKIERLFFLGQVIEIVHLSSRTGIDVEALLRLQLEVSGRLGVTRLRTVLGGVQFESPADGPASEALLRQLDFHVSKLTQLCAGDDIEAVWTSFGLDDLSRKLHRLIERGEVSLGSIVLVDSYLRRVLPAQQGDVQN